MSCGHCVNAVSSELKDIEGVDVDLHAENASAVTVTSTAPLQREAVAAALAEAGDYRIVDA